MNAKELFKRRKPLRFGRNVVAEIETNKRWARHVGKLWVQSSWLSVAEARLLRDWLDKALP